jgi:hypothetical protein
MVQGKTYGARVVLKPIHPYRLLILEDRPEHAKALGKMRKSIDLALCQAFVDERGDRPAVQHDGCAITRLSRQASNIDCPLQDLNRIPKTGQPDERIE